MKIDSKLKYIFTLELSLKEYQLVCDGMSELEAVTPPGAPDYPAIAEMEEQLGENRGTAQNGPGKILITSPVRDLNRNLTDAQK